MNKKPFIFINFKKLSSDRAISLAKELENVDRRILELFDVAVGVLVEDCCSIASETTLPVFLQDFNSIQDAQVRDAGIRGVILNHPEQAMTHEQIRQDLDAAQKNRFQTILCAASLEECDTIRSRYTADFIAVENPDIIGKDISLVESSKEYVGKALEKAGHQPILFGGGIKSSRDINFVIEAGGAGVLVSSLIVKSAKPLGALTELLNPIYYKHLSKKPEEATCQ